MTSRWAGRPDLEYADKVLSGEILACKLTKQACQRHLDDLDKIEGDPEWQYVFDPQRGSEPIEFARLFCRHYQGYSAGQAFDFDLWQCFIAMSLFGWVHKETGLRRFSEGVVYVARKNGKSTLGAPLSLYTTFYEGEPGAQGYFIATKEDQARLAFDMARHMSLRSSSLIEKLKVKTKEINTGLGECYMKPLGQDSKTLDGLNAHFILCDELHAHETRELYDVMDSSTVGRTQPLTFCISTAGAAIENGLGRIKWHHVEQILNGSIKDEGTFGIIYTIDEDDNWRDPKCWAKANPGLGVSIHMDRLMSIYNRRVNEPGGADEFRKKHCNQWLASEAMAYDMEKWHASKPEGHSIEIIKRMTSYGGLDLARREDFSCFALWTPVEEEWDKGPNRIEVWSWIPDHMVEDKGRRCRIPIHDWIEQGYVEPTPGTTTNYGVIRQRINEIGEKYNVHSISFDPAFADQLVSDLESDGFEMIEIPQFPRHLTAATQEFGRQMYAGVLDHRDNPVLTWMVSNCVYKPSNDDYLKLDKKLSIEKIDGVTANVNGMTSWIKIRSEFFNSRYDDPDEDVIMVKSDRIREVAGV